MRPGRSCLCRPMSVAAFLCRRQRSVYVRCSVLRRRIRSAILLPADSHVCPPVGSCYLCLNAYSYPSTRHSCRHLYNQWPVLAFSLTTYKKHFSPTPNIHRSQKLCRHRPLHHVHRHPSSLLHLEGYFIASWRWWGIGGRGKPA